MSGPQRFARTHGPLRPVVERVLRGFMRCGLVGHAGGWSLRTIDWPGCPSRPFVTMRRRVHPLVRAVAVLATASLVLAPAPGRAQLETPRAVGLNLIPLPADAGPIHALISPQGSVDLDAAFDLGLERIGDEDPALARVLARLRTPDDTPPRFRSLRDLVVDVGLGSAEYQLLSLLSLLDPGEADRDVWAVLLRGETGYRALHFPPPGDTPADLLRWVSARAIGVSPRLELWERAYRSYYEQGKRWRDTDWQTVIARSTRRGQLQEQLDDYFSAFWEIPDDAAWAFAGEESDPEGGPIPVGRQWLGMLTREQREAIQAHFVLTEVWPVLLRHFQQAYSDAARQARAGAERAFDRLRFQLEQVYDVIVDVDGPAEQRAGTPVTVGPWTSPTDPHGRTRFRFTLYAYLGAGFPGVGIGGRERAALRFPPESRLARARIPLLAAPPGDLVIDVVEAETGRPLPAWMEVDVDNPDGLEIEPLDDDWEGIHDPPSRLRRQLTSGLVYTFTVRATDREHYDETLRLEVAPGDNGTRVVSLPRFRVRFSSTVLDAATGWPIPGARVSMSLRGGRSPESLKTDAGGRATREVAFGEYDLVVDADGYVTLDATRTLDWRVPLDDEEVRETFRLAPESAPVEPQRGGPATEEETASAALSPTDTLEGLCACVIADRAAYWQAEIAGTQRAYPEARVKVTVVSPGRWDPTAGRCVGRVTRETVYSRNDSKVWTLVFDWSQSGGIPNPPRQLSYPQGCCTVFVRGTCWNAQ